MSDEKEIEVQIEAEAQQDDPAVEIVKDEKKEAASDDVSDVIKAQAQEYEAKLEAERREKEEARRRAENAEREAKLATAKVADSELDAVTNAIHAVEMEREAVKGRLKTAMESGDFEGTIKAQEALAEVVTKLSSLKEGKTYIEQKKVEAPVTNPEEAYISRFTPRSQEYLRQHRELISDTTKNKRMIAAHYEAEAEGLVPDTEAYFKFLDQKLGYGEQVQQKQTAQRQTRAPAAPISRGDGGDISSGGPAVIKLTPGEARAATDGSIIWNSGPNKGEPIGVKEYARRKAIMIKQGQYSEAMQ